MFDEQEYLSRPDALTFSDALQTYNAIHTPQSVNDSDFQELWRDVVTAALKYVDARNQWLLMSPSERVEYDQKRTLSHNNYLTTLSILGRYCHNQWQSTWLETMGDLNSNRKFVGDFAGYIVLFGSLAAR
jgi:hypothetical protein